MGLNIYAFLGLQCNVPIKSRFHSFQLLCTNKYYIGSRCTVFCSKTETIRGIKSITCLPNRRWSIDLRAIKCVPLINCAANIPRARCYVSPCKYAKCPGEPTAECIDNYCGGCNAIFFLNGKRLKRQSCLPKRKFFIA